MRLSECAWIYYGDFIIYRFHGYFVTGQETPFGLPKISNQTTRFPSITAAKSYCDALSGSKNNDDKFFPYASKVNEDGKVMFLNSAINK